MADGWTSAPTPPPAPQPGALSVETQQILNYCGTVDQVLLNWKSAKDDLDRAKGLEAKLRTAVFELKFPNAKEGTQREPLGNGYFVKAVYPMNYTLDKERTEKALDDIAALGPKAEFIADRIAKWTPELVIKEWREICNAAAGGDPDAIKIKAFVDGVLTIKPGMPQLEIEEPKPGK
jgi:hypothetical protein